MRKEVRLICEVCFSRNYKASKHPDEKRRLEVKKFCRRCNRHTTHKESK